MENLAISIIWRDLALFEDTFHYLSDREGWIDRIITIPTEMLLRTPIFPIHLHYSISPIDCGAYIIQCQFCQQPLEVLFLLILIHIREVFLICLVYRIQILMAITQGPIAISFMEHHP